MELLNSRVQGFPPGGSVISPGGTCRQLPSTHSSRSYVICVCSSSHTTHMCSSFLARWLAGYFFPFHSPEILHEELRQFEEAAGWSPRSLQHRKGGPTKSLVRRQFLRRSHRTFFHDHRKIDHANQESQAFVNGDVSWRLQAGQSNGGPAVCLPEKTEWLQRRGSTGSTEITDNGQLDNFLLTALNPDGGLGQLASGM